MRAGPMGRLNGEHLFLPTSQGAWAEYPKLEDFFIYNGSGVQTKRTWVIAPDAKSLEDRWNVLIRAEESEKEELFHPTLRRWPPRRSAYSIRRERRLTRVSCKPDAHR